MCGWHPRTQRWLRETITSLKGIWGKRSLTKACTSVTNITSGPLDSPYLGLGGEGKAENKTAPGTQKERRQEKAVEASRPPALFRSKLLKFLGNGKSVLSVVCGAR